MEDVGLLKEAAKQGLWAVLFVSLYAYQLKENKTNRLEAREREDKLMTFIDQISDQFENLAKQYERISADVGEIKQEIRKREGS